MENLIITAVASTCFSIILMVMITRHILKKRELSPGIPDHSSSEVTYTVTEVTDKVFKVKATNLMINSISPEVHFFLFTYQDKSVLILREHEVRSIWCDDFIETTCPSQSSARRIISQRDSPF